MSDANRSAFESWAQKEGHPIARMATGPYVFAGTGSLWAGWMAALAQPIHRVAGDATDAERYRWIAENPGYIRPHLNGQAVYVNWSGTRDALNNAIDAAIAASKKDAP